MELPTKNTSHFLRLVLRPAPEFPFVRSVFNMHDDDALNCECLPSAFVSVEEWFFWSQVFFFFPPKQNLEYPGTPCQHECCQVA